MGGGGEGGGRSREAAPRPPRRAWAGAQLWLVGERGGGGRSRARCFEVVSRVGMDDRKRPNGAGKRTGGRRTRCAARHGEFAACASAELPPRAAPATAPASQKLTALLIAAAPRIFTVATSIFAAATRDLCSCLAPATTASATTTARSACASTSRPPRARTAAHTSRSRRRTSRTSRCSRRSSSRRCCCASRRRTGRGRG